MYGLTTLLLSRRTLEIGIRKVLGASPSGIFWLLSEESTHTVAMVAVVATPLTYLLAGLWLDNFSFHIALSATTYLYSILLDLAIMFSTMSYQTFKTLI